MSVSVYRLLSFYAFKHLRIVTNTLKHFHHNTVKKKNIVKGEQAKIEKYKDLAGQIGEIYQNVAQFVSFVVDAHVTISRNLSASLDLFGISSGCRGVSATRNSSCAMKCAVWTSTSKSWRGSQIR